MKVFIAALAIAALAASVAAEQGPYTYKRSLYDSLYPSIISKSYDSFYPSIISKSYDSIYPKSYDSIYPKSYDSVYNSYDSLYPSIYSKSYDSQYPSIFSKSYDSFYPSIFSKNYDSFYPGRFYQSSPVMESGYYPARYFQSLPLDGFNKYFPSRFYQPYPIFARTPVFADYNREFVDPVSYYAAPSSPLVAEKIIKEVIVEKDVPEVTYSQKLPYTLVQKEEIKPIVETVVEKFVKPSTETVVEKFVKPATETVVEKFVQQPEVQTIVEKIPAEQYSTNVMETQPGKVSQYMIYKGDKYPLEQFSTMKESQSSNQYSQGSNMMAEKEITTASKVGMMSDKFNQHSVPVESIKEGMYASKN